MLMNFKSDNYTGISAIIPANLKLQEQKPGFILTKILEDFKSCNEIGIDKRPDSLFPQLPYEFTTKLPFSLLVSTHLSELLEKGIKNLPSGILAIDVIYDQSPTCSKVLSLLANLTSFRNFEVAGIITAHGFCHASYLKSMETWRCYSEGKMYPWAKVVWQICSNSSYPVLIVLSNSLMKNSPCFLSKTELDSIEKFCKLQDSRIKMTYKEEYTETSETTTRVVISKKSEKPDSKDYTLDYVRKTQEILKKDIASLEEKFDHRPYKLEKDYRVFTPSLLSDRGIKDNKETKDEKLQYKRIVQDHRPNSSNSNNLSSSSSQNNLQTRGRNFSTEPYQSKAPISRSYKEDLLYKGSRNSSIDPKDSSTRPGILKNSYGDSRFSKGKANSPVFSPREPNSCRTLRDSYSENFDDEPTEKPSSILKNGWISDRKTETVEKKVNFSDKVFHVDNTIKGQMPEIKLTSVKFPDKLTSKTPDFKLDSTEPRLLIPYKVTDFSQSLQKLESSQSWPCPKCSKSIPSTAFECNNCRFINWDKFYSLKSKSNKTRAESIPVKVTQRDDSIKPTYFETRTRDLGRDQGKGLGNEIKVQDTYMSELSSRKSSRDYQFNR